MNNGPHQVAGDEECFFEWCMGPANASINDEVYLRAWQKFFELRHQIFLSSRFEA